MRSEAKLGIIGIEGSYQAFGYAWAGVRRRVDA
jgi:hypothetical protein